MRSDTSPGKKRLLTVLIVAVLIAAAFAVKPVKIFYHDAAMRRAWNQTFQQGATSFATVPVFERHRDALVGLGYLSRQMFPIEQIKPQSPEHRALYNALTEHGSKANGYFSMQGFESSTPLIVIVWAAPAQMPSWEAIIKAHDQPKNEAPR